MLVRCAWLAVGAAPFQQVTMRQRSVVLHRREALSATIPLPCSLCARKPVRTIVSRFFQFNRFCTRLPTSKRCISAALPALHFQPTASRACRRGAFARLKLTAQNTSDIQHLLSDVIWYLTSHEHRNAASSRRRREQQGETRQSDTARPTRGARTKDGDPPAPPQEEPQLKTATSPRQGAHRHARDL